MKKLSLIISCLGIISTAASAQKLERAQPAPPQKVEMAQPTQQAKPVINADVPANAEPVANTPHQKPVKPTQTSPRKPPGKNNLSTMPPSPPPQVKQQEK